MREAVVRFGAQKSLVGVVTDPENGTATGGLGCVFLNAGFTPRIGPQRLSVLLARRLAAIGIPALRFDFSGIGDSPSRQDNMSFADSTVSETQEAMSLLAATRGVQHFVLIGVCWGADNALRVSQVDERVVGVGAVDFYALFSMRYLVRTHRGRLADPRSWWRLLRGASPAIGRALGGLLELAKQRRAARGDTSGDLLPVKAPATVVAELRAGIERGVEMCFVYARGAPSYDQYVMNFAAPMRDLEGPGRLRIELFDDADHVFTLLSNQGALMDALVEWTRQLAARRAAAGGPTVSESLTH